MGIDFEDDHPSSSKKPKTTGFKSTSRRLRQGKETHLSHRASLDWRQDSLRVCSVGGDAFEYADLGGMKELLRRSMTGAALLEAHDGNTLKIFYDPQTPMSQFYARGPDCIITLNPQRPRGDLLNMLARELRRAWQHRQGALVNPMSFEPEDAILVNRAQQADVFMLSIKVAWELKLLGEAEAWNFLVASSMADMTRAFETQAQNDFRTLNNGLAARAAYDKFFEDAHTKTHDKRIIHQMLLDDRGYMKSLKPHDRVTMALFQRLGELPHGSNYLTGRHKRQPTDLCYATVENRSNANYLWFVKFERNFQERELKMLEESVKASAEIVEFAAWQQAHHSPGRGV